MIICSGDVLRYRCSFQILQYLYTIYAGEKCCTLLVANTLGRLQLKFLAHNASQKIVGRGVSQFSTITGDILKPKSTLGGHTSFSNSAAFKAAALAGV